MSTFEGDWTEIPGFVNHVKKIQEWIANYGIEAVFEPNSEFELSEEANVQVDASEGEIWTIIYLDEGWCLERGLYESVNATGFVLTKSSPVSDDLEEESTINLDAEIACPDCSETDADEGEGCEKCEFDGTLFLAWEEMGLPF